MRLPCEVLRMLWSDRLESFSDSSVSELEDPHSIRGYGKMRISQSINRCFDDQPNEKLRWCCSKSAGIIRY